MFMDICSMRILLIAASSKEIQDTIGFAEDNKYRVGDHEIQTAITGIGLVSTTYFLTRYIKDNRPDLVIQAGIAGCFLNNKITEIYAVREDALADMGVLENNLFKNIFDLQLADKNDKPFTDGSLINPYQKLLALSDFEQIKAISINEITTDKKRMEWYQQKFFPVVESMEGAAFHYVCLQENIPFLQIRAISNYIGERDKSKWDINGAIYKLNEQLILLIKKLIPYNETYFRV